MESIGDFKAAVAYYKEALALEPVRTPTWYFINNNLGFSLNQLGEFTEARDLPQGDRNRSQSSRCIQNLGLALSGQGDYRGAANCFVTATQVNAGDPRSLRHSRVLVKEHPELEFEFQGKIEFLPGSS